MDSRRALEPPPFREFEKRRDGMIHAMDGGLWLHAARTLGVDPERR